jgi:hypothetical protein
MQSGAGEFFGAAGRGVLRKMSVSGKFIEHERPSAADGRFSEIYNYISQIPPN